MSYELVDLDIALKKEISSEAELRHAEEVQSIINYTGFSFIEICKVCQGPILFGPRDSFLITSSIFDSTKLNTYQFAIDVCKKLKFILCEDKRSTPSTTYVVVFPAHKEQEYTQILKRVNRLKAFL